MLRLLGGSPTLDVSRGVLYGGKLGFGLYHAHRMGFINSVLGKVPAIQQAIMTGLANSLTTVIEGGRMATIDILSGLANRMMNVPNDQTPVAFGLNSAASIFDRAFTGFADGVYAETFDDGLNDGSLLERAIDILDAGITGAVAGQLRNGKIFQDVLDKDGFFAKFGKGAYDLTFTYLGEALVTLLGHERTPLRIGLAGGFIKFTFASIYRFMHGNDPRFV